MAEASIGFFMSEATNTVAALLIISTGYGHHHTHTHTHISLSLSLSLSLSSHMDIHPLVSSVILRTYNNSATPSRPLQWP